MVGDYTIKNMGVMCPLVFEPEAHTYTHRDTGEQYLSWSRFMDLFKIPFDKKIAKFSAKGNGITEKEQLQRWEDNKKKSIDHGNYIHDGLELYFNTNRHTDPRIVNAGEQISTIIGPYYKAFNELVVWNDKYKLCGTGDRMILRCRQPNAILDVYDYKTNLSKGIYYHSSAYDKHGVYKHKKKFFLGPISHLEDCNYNGYALQMSFYAYMASAIWGLVVGQLSIPFISFDPNDSTKSIVTRLPVPYLKLEIEAMLKYYETLKPLPPVKKVKALPAQKTNFIKDVEW